ncbi:MAG: hypothetical protein HQL53_03940 [Magnetococcales bacterium]|nr:hypothetical protein [Magnetococcales bacterium]
MGGHDQVDGWGVGGYNIQAICKRVLVEVEQRSGSVVVRKDGHDGGCLCPGGSVYWLMLKQSLSLALLMIALLMIALLMIALLMAALFGFLEAFVECMVKV